LGFAKEMARAVMRGWCMGGYLYVAGFVGMAGIVRDVLKLVVEERVGGWV